MNLKSLMVYSSALIIPFIFSEKSFAESRAKCEWDLPISLNVENGKFNKETAKISCNVKRDYRKWPKKGQIIGEENTERYKFKIEYKSGKETYYEIWSSSGRLELLIADTLYHFKK